MTPEEIDLKNKIDSVDENLKRISQLISDLEGYVRENILHEIDNIHYYLGASKTLLATLKRKTKE